MRSEIFYVHLLELLLGQVIDLVGCAFEEEFGTDYLDGVIFPSY